MPPLVSKNASSCTKPVSMFTLFYTLVPLLSTQHVLLCAMEHRCVRIPCLVLECVCVRETWRQWAWCGSKKCCCRMPFWVEVSKREPKRACRRKTWFCCNIQTSVRLIHVNILKCQIKRWKCTCLSQCLCNTHITSHLPLLNVRNGEFTICAYSRESLKAKTGLEIVVFTVWGTCIRACYSRQKHLWTSYLAQYRWQMCVNMPHCSTFQSVSAVWCRRNT